jgi:hypothetical protein
MRIERKREMAEIKKAKLSGGPDKTVTWISLDPEKGGRLKIEYYDFSESAQKLFGNDIDCTITVNEIDKLYSMVNQNETSHSMDRAIFQELFWHQKMAGRKWN